MHTIKTHQNLKKGEGGKDYASYGTYSNRMDMTKTSVKHHSNHKQRIMEDLVKNDVGEENIHEFALTDGIRWRNDKKEYWLHAADKVTANHIRDRWKRLPKLENPKPWRVTLV